MKIIRTLVLLSTILVLLLCMSGCDFTQYVAHYANVAGWTTRINIQNPHTVDVQVTIDAFDNAGVLSGTAVVTIPARGFVKDYVQNLFPAAIPGTGSLRITAAEPTGIPKVSSIIIFDYNGGPSMGGLQSFAHPAKVIHIPWFENSETFHTGIAVLNVNDYPIVAVLVATTASGTVHYSDTFHLQPMQRIIGYPTDYFPGGLPAETNLSIQASGNVAAFIILHDSTYTKVEAINGVPEIPKKVEYGYPDTYSDLNSRPNEMVCTPDGSRLFIRTESPSQFVAFDIPNRTVTGHIDLSGWGGLAIHPDGLSLFIGDTSLGKVLLFNLRNETMTEFADFPDPRNIAVSNDGRWLGVAGTTYYRLYDLNGTGFHEVATGLTHVYDCAFTGDSACFMVVDHTGQKLHAIDVNSHVITEVSLPISPRCLVQHPGNGQIYIAGAEDKLMEITYPGFSINSTLTLGGNVYAMVFSPDGRMLYIPCLTDDMLWTYDPYSMLLSPMRSLYGDVVCIQTTPEGDMLFFALNDLPFTLRSWSY